MPKTGQTAGAKRRFLEEYARCGTIGEAARRANVGRASHFVWMNDDPEYKARFNDAKEEACDLLISEARRRAAEGVEEPVFFQGQQCGTVLKYSDNLLMFLIKGWRPEIYRDQWKGELQHTGVMAVSRGPDLKVLSDEQLTQLEQLALSAGSSALADAGSGSDPGGEGEESAEQD